MELFMLLGWLISGQDWLQDGRSARPPGPAEYVAPNPEEGLDFKFSVVGDPGNPHDAAWDIFPPSYGIPQVGSVPYVFRISRYEVTREQYLPFLNAVDPWGGNKGRVVLFGFEADMDEPPGYRWKLTEGPANLPVEVTWYAAARYVNWLDYWYKNGHPGLRGTEMGTDTEGVYDTRNFWDTDMANDPDGRNPGATIWLTTHNEWYKAAYWDAAAEVYWRYPLGSHDAPRGGMPDYDGSDGNMVVSGRDPEPDRPYPGVPIPVGSYPHATGLYNVYDMCGNVAEWTEDKNWTSTLFDHVDGRHSLGGHSGWYPDHTSTWAQVGFATHRTYPYGSGGIRLSTAFDLKFYLQRDLPEQAREAVLNQLLKRAITK